MTEQKDAWHNAVLDACMIRECCYVPDDPALTIRQLLEWEAQTALDPAVSDKAQALIRRGWEERR
jgi:hypothetical protein